MQLNAIVVDLSFSETEKSPSWGRVCRAFYTQQLILSYVVVQARVKCIWINLKLFKFRQKRAKCKRINVELVWQFSLKRVGLSYSPIKALCTHQHRIGFPCECLYVREKQQKARHSWLWSDFFMCGGHDVWRRLENTPCAVFFFFTNFFSSAQTQWTNYLCQCNWNETAMTLQPFVQSEVV